MRNEIIDNIRGLCLLGVIGIHVGSLALPTNSFVLYSLLEILSRYSVPAFFFVSGYGLFCTDKYLLALAKGETCEDTFTYFEFIKKRLVSSAIPYISWSYFYQIYFWLTMGYIAKAPSEQFFVMSFGLSCYHLYFMVILIVFYLTHPLWRRLMSLMLRTSLAGGMGVLFILQLIFFYYSSHNHINPDTWLPWLKNMYVFRLNYIPFYYLFIYMLGGVLALYWYKACQLLRRYFLLITGLYIASIIYIEGSAYYSYTCENFDLLSLAYTYHQLCPQGLIYTTASILFFCGGLQLWQEKCSHADTPNSLWSSLHKPFYQGLKLLTKYSMLMYFLHPLFLEWITSYMQLHGIVPTVKKVALAYWVLVGITLIASMLLQKLFAKSAPLRKLFTGR